MYDSKGKKFLQILIIIASMSTPFVGAYSWILLLGRNEVITKFLTNALYLPAIDIYGFKGIILVFTLQLFPLVFLYVAGTMNSIDNSLLEAAESLGSSRLNTFAKITTPMMLSGIISGAILSWVTMISKLSTSILLYNVKTRTMTVAIYTEVLRGNYGVAAALSTILTVLTVGSLLLFMKISKSNSITL